MSSSYSFDIPQNQSAYHTKNTADKPEANADDYKEKARSTLEKKIKILIKKSSMGQTFLRIHRLMWKMNQFVFMTKTVNSSVCLKTFCQNICCFLEESDAEKQRFSIRSYVRFPKG